MSATPSSVTGLGLLVGSQGPELGGGFTGLDWLIVGLALVQGVLIASAFNVRRVRRTALVVPASA